MVDYYSEESWTNRLVVAAIDIGTTHSGYAFSLLDQYKKDPTKILANNNWRSGDNLVTPKTPTCLLLKPNQSFHSFGYKAEEKYADLADDNEDDEWYFFRHFKMVLYDPKQALKRDLKIKEERGKELQALVVFSLSIKYLKDHLLEAVHEKVPNIRDEDIYWVLTVPAIWGDQAKQFMREAAERAGIAPEHLRLALEPECAAVMCRTVPMSRSGYKGGASSTADIEAMGPGSAYMVLDMGGGTFDVTVHEIWADSTLKELHRASGGPWGGHNVNDAFKQFMIKIVGANVWMKFQENHMEDFLYLQRNFEQKKCAVDQSSSVKLRTPKSLFELHEDEHEDFNKSLRQTRFSKAVKQNRDKLTIDYDTFIKEFYEETLSKLAQHIKDILQTVDRPISTFLLVGGFSESTIVKSCIKEHFKNVALVVPEDANLAVVKGAILYGRNPEIISSRVCRYTYGFEWSEEYDPRVHPASKKERTDEGFVCTEVFKCLVEKDQVLQIGHTTEEIEVFVKYKYQDKIEFPFYQSTDKHPLLVSDRSCTYLGTLHMDVPDTDDGLNRSVFISVRFGGTEIRPIARDPKTGKTKTARFDLL